MTKNLIKSMNSIILSALFSLSTMSLSVAQTTTQEMKISGQQKIGEDYLTAACANLVVNGGFESMDHPPTCLRYESGNPFGPPVVVSDGTTTYNIDCATMWQPTHPTFFSNTSPDYYYVGLDLSCEAGSPTPHSGNANAGIAKDEFIQQSNSTTPVPITVIPGRYYRIEYYVKRDRPVPLSIQVAFTNSPADAYLATNLSPLPATEVLESGGWYKVTSYYTATTSSVYMVLGGFASQECYSYVDDISMVEAPKVQIAGNTSVCAADAFSTTYTASSGTAYQWQSNIPGYPSGSGSTFTINGPLTGVTANTNYTVTVTATLTGGCTTASTYTFHVDIMPSTPAVNGNPVICSGDAAVLQAVTTGPWSGWYNNDLTAMYTPSKTLTATVPGIYKACNQNGTCKSCITITVTTASKPVVTATASPKTCPTANDGNINTTVTGGTPAYTYNWNSGQTTANITNMAVGTYTVTVKDSKGCSNTASATIIQAPAMYVTVSEYKPACANTSNGSIVVYAWNGTGPYTCVWSNGQTGNVLNNIAAGSYSVIVTDGKGCTATGSGAVSTLVVAAPQLTPNTGSLCTGAITTYSVTSPAPNTTYSWSPSQGTVVSGQGGSTPTINWGSTGSDVTLTVTVTSSTPTNQYCSSTFSYTFTKCCDNIGVNDLIVGATGTTTLAQFKALYPSKVSQLGNTYNYSYTAGKLYINGQLLIQPNETFVVNGSEIVFGTNAEIVLLAGGTNTSIQLSNAKLHAGCGVMWKGITLSNNTCNITLSFSQIEDAITAIQCNNGAVYKIQSSTLNKNFKGIVLKDVTGTYTGYIQKTKITSVASVTSPGNDLLSPKNSSFATPNRTTVGIEVENVQNITISGGLTPGVGNVFDNVDVGISGIKSNLTIYNNEFKNINANTNNLIAGIAIMAIGDPALTGASAKTLTVGSASAAHTNYIHDGIHGIHVYNNMNTIVKRNNIKNLTQKGFYASGNNQCTIELSNHNDIENIFTGIHCWSNPGSTIKINDNDIDMASVSLARGILIEESSIGTNTKTEINRNIVNNVRKGIWLVNIAGGVPYNCLVEYNQVNILNPASSANDADGILEQNCYNILTDYNYVKGTNTNYWINGIRCDLGSGNIIKCNDVQTVGRAIWVGGNQPGTKVDRNVMRNSYTGYILNWGSTGAQGGVNDPSDNQWLGTFTNHTESWGSNGSASPLYVRNLPATYYYPSPFLTAAGGGGSVLPAIPTTGYRANCVLSMPVINNGTAQSVMSEAVIRLNNMLGENINGVRNLSDDQLAELRNIAQECPYTYGEAVYTARVILSSINSKSVNYTGECEMLGENTNVTSSVAKTENISDVKLYPNPNDGNMTLQYELQSSESGVFTMYDLTGKIVDQYQLDATKTNLSVTNTELTNGMYFYDVQLNGHVVVKDKITIIR